MGTKITRQGARSFLKARLECIRDNNTALNQRIDLLKAAQEECCECECPSFVYINGFFTANIPNDPFFPAQFAIFKTPVQFIIGDPPEGLEYDNNCLYVGEVEGIVSQGNYNEAALNPYYYYRKNNKWILAGTKNGQIVQISITTAEFIDRCDSYRCFDGRILYKNNILWNRIYGTECNEIIGFFLKSVNKPSLLPYGVYKDPEGQSKATLEDDVISLWKDMTGLIKFDAANNNLSRPRLHFESGIPVLRFREQGQALGNLSANVTNGQSVAISVLINLFDYGDLTERLIGIVGANSYPSNGVGLLAKYRNVAGVGQYLIRFHAHGNNTPMEIEAPITKSQWHVVTGVSTPTETQLWIDGILVTSAPGNYYNPRQDFYIGRNTQSPWSNTFRGDMAAVAVYRANDRVQYEYEMSQIFNTSYPSSSSSSSIDLDDPIADIDFIRRIHLGRITNSIKNKMELVNELGQIATPGNKIAAIKFDGVIQATQAASNAMPLLTEFSDAFYALRGINFDGLNDFLEIGSIPSNIVIIAAFSYTVPNKVSLVERLNPSDGGKLGGVIVPTFSDGVWKMTFDNSPYPVDALINDVALDVDGINNVPSGELTVVIRPQQSGPTIARGIGQIDLTQFSSMRLTSLFIAPGNISPTDLQRVVTFTDSLSVREL